MYNGNNGAYTFLSLLDTGTHSLPFHFAPNSFADDSYAKWLDAFE